MYSSVVDSIAAGVGGDARSAMTASPINFKPIGSLFNKIFVRRGEGAVNVAADILRGTLEIDDAAAPELLGQVVAFLREACADNFETPLPKDSYTSLLQAVAAMSPLPTDGGSSGEDFGDVVPYRLKANGSQTGAGGSAPRLYNLNFFIHTPWWYRAGAQQVVCACELQIGDASVIRGLRSDHVTYERDRILGALPLLRAVVEGGEASEGVDYAALNQLLYRQRTLELVCRWGGPT